MSAISLSVSSPSPEQDLENLLARMRQRWYPETMDVLASYWLKTVYVRGHERRWWKHLGGLLDRVLEQETVCDSSRKALGEIREWIRTNILLPGKAPAPLPARHEPLRANLSPEYLPPYLNRLLNEWLSGEIASLLVSESSEPGPLDTGIPALAVGRCLERLLVREHLSPATLEMLLRPELLSPKYIYPADAEMLTDVVLSLLGRTEAPTPPVMPATMLAVSSGSPFSADYSDAVQGAVLVARPGSEEIHVPIGTSQALEICKGGAVRIASFLVTMDGRWWESESLQSGERSLVVYKPRGRLRIDYSADHVKLVAPWPDKQLTWTGEVHLGGPLQLFGREWSAGSWETDGSGAWLHLVFSRTLPIAAIVPAPEALRRSRPASVDMAWSALEDALAAAIAAKNRDPIEQLRRSDFIPLARSIFGLAESISARRVLDRETLDTQLRAIRYLQAGIALEYGRPPWRIVPAPVRAYFLKNRMDPALIELLQETFDGLPEALTKSSSHPHSTQAA